MIDHQSGDDIVRPDPELVLAAAVLGSATMHEAQGRQGFVGPDVRPVLAATRVAGPAVTVSCRPGDNLPIHVAVERCRPGDVLVVSHTSPSDHGVLGELLATSLQARGVVAFVTDAGVRDVGELRTMGFPVWSRVVSCHGTVKEWAGAVNQPVVLGEVTVEPGDVVVADDDGVVVVPSGAFGAAVAEGQARAERETAVRLRLAAGELGLDIYALRERVKASAEPGAAD